MSDRERLIEIIEQARREAVGTIGSMNNGFATWYADKLMEAGVTPVMHGEWEQSLKQYSYYQYRCSVCGCDNYSHITRNGVVKVMKFCPNCGAKMDGGNYETD